jgi:hypothetical protein
MTLPVQVTLPDGEAVEIVETSGEMIVLRVTSSSPPGSTLAFRLQNVAAPYRVKVRGCRKIADADSLPFRIEGRLFDLTREQRSALTASCR